MVHTLEVWRKLQPDSKPILWYKVTRPETAASLMAHAVEIIHILADSTTVVKVVIRRVE